MSDLEIRVRQCFLTVLPDIGAEQLQEAALDVTSEWDSIATVNLVIVLEEEFHITIDPVDFDKLTSYSSVLSYIQTYNANAEASA